MIGAAATAVASPAWLVSPLWMLLSLSLLFPAVTKRTVGMILVALLAGMLLGLWRGTNLQREYRHYGAYYGETIRLQGKVAEDPIYEEDGGLRMKLGSPRINDEPFAGIIWISSSSSAEVRRGDLVMVQGSLSKGFGNLPAAMYRAEIIQVHQPQPGDVARRLRDWFAGGVRRSVQEPEASLGLGFLAGQQSALPEVLSDNLRILGLTHIVVASGYNLTILVRFTRRLLAQYSKFAATAVAAAVTLGFMLIAGLSPSMVRAGLVTGLSLLAWYYGRSIQPMVLLTFAAAITVMINPAYVWGDVGWSLSFAAFAGVIILAPLLERYFFGQHSKDNAVKQVLIETVSAQIVTLPIIAYAFGNLAPLAIPANMLILPLIPLVMVCTFMAGWAGLLLPAAASWFGLPATLLLQYMTWVTDELSEIPFAHGEVSITSPVALLAYGCIIGLILFLRRKTGYTFSKESRLV